MMEGRNEWLFLIKAAQHYRKGVDMVSFTPIRTVTPIRPGHSTTEASIFGTLWPSPSLSSRPQIVFYCFGLVAVYCDAPSILFGLGASSTRHGVFAGYG